MSMFSKWVIIILFCLSVSTGYADSIGDLADNLMGPVAGLGKILNAICFIAGTGFILGALLQYKYHRENPQQVRISTPIVLLCLGLIIIAIPMVAYFSESGNFLR